MDTKKLGKWIIAGILGMGALAVTLPIISGIVWNAVSILVGLMVFGGLLLILPTVAELLQDFTFYIWYTWLTNNPIPKLYRELLEFGKEIESLDKERAEVIGARANMEAEFKKQKPYLDQADQLEWNEQISELKDAEKGLEDDRLDLQQEFIQMERDVKREEANWSLAKARDKAAKALIKAGKMASGTDGSRIAIQAIQDRLAKSKARLDVARSRRTIATKAKDMKKAAAAATFQQPAIANDPSPTLVTNVGTVPSDAVEVKQAQISGKLGKFLSD